jgi:hypothetical protein
MIVHFMLFALFHWLQFIWIKFELKFHVQIQKHFCFLLSFPPPSLLLWAQPSRPLFPSFFLPFSPSPCSPAHSLSLPFLLFFLSSVPAHFPARGPPFPLFSPRTRTARQPFSPGPSAHPFLSPLSLSLSLSLARGPRPSELSSPRRTGLRSESGSLAPRDLRPPPYPPRARTPRRPHGRPINAARTLARSSPKPQPPCAPNPSSRRCLAARVSGRRRTTASLPPAVV